MIVAEPDQINPKLKRQVDASKIVKFEMSGFKHIYCYDEWREWTGNNYIKSYYDVLLQDGTILYHSWPNGGTLNKGREGFDKHSNVKVRLSEGYPY